MLCIISTCPADGLRCATAHRKSFRIYYSMYPQHQISSCEKMGMSLWGVGVGWACPCGGGGGHGAVFSPQPEGTYMYVGTYVRAYVLPWTERFLISFKMAA